jgi:hypothetical protein
MMGDGIADWNPANFLQSLGLEFKAQGMNVDAAKWQGINVPDFFNHIFGWFDALNVDFWNE